jgi:hypothetical protein
MLANTGKASFAVQILYIILARSFRDQQLKIPTMPLFVEVVQTLGVGVPMWFMGLIAVTVFRPIDILCIPMLTALCSLVVATQ